MNKDRSLTKKSPKDKILHLTLMFNVLHINSIALNANKI